MIFFKKSTLFFMLLAAATAQAQSVKLNQVTLSNYVFSDTGSGNFIGKILAGGKIEKTRATGKTRSCFQISDGSVSLTSEGLKQIRDKKRLQLNLSAKVNGKGRQKTGYTILLNGFNRNKVIAHRGAWKKLNLPQNSIAALRQAFALGLEGSEFDVHLTADNVLVVNHDPDFEGLRIEKSTYGQLLQKQLPNGEKIPTLEAFLKEGMKQQGTKLILEVKASVVSKERSILLTNHILNMVQNLQAQAWINYISFDYDVLKRVLQIEPSANVSYLKGLFPPEQLKKDRISGADYYFSVYQKNESWIEMAHKLGLTINAWTVDDPEVMKWLLIRDADYITTNEPEKLLELVKEKLYK